MAEYVEKEYYCENVCHCPGLKKGCSKEKCNIWTAPAADVAPVVHGRWIKRKTWNYCVCSECSFENRPYMIGSNYCPNCGARMDGDQK